MAKIRESLVLQRGMCLRDLLIRVISQRLRLRTRDDVVYLITDRISTPQRLCQSWLANSKSRVDLEPPIPNIVTISILTSQRESWASADV